MSDMMENKLNAEELGAVSGGHKPGNNHFKVNSIRPYWVKVTASSLYCRVAPYGRIIKTFDHDRKLKVDGITDKPDEWYRLLVEDPDTHSMIYGYICKAYTERL